jgi:phenylpropionate dioxygenase-like ring-hydroxylating dioxygenase large terminal subunit
MSAAITTVEYHPQKHQVFNQPMQIVEGWYWVIQSRRLKRGSTESATVMGRELVVYRTQDGEPVVIDAYCPHMGCHLALGKVEADRLRCFFHNWAFDREGHCVDIPSLKQPLPGVRIQRWNCREKNGLIWVWTGRGEPDHEIPEPDELAGGDYDHMLGKVFRKRCHPNVVMINAIDEEHFRTVHHIPGHLMDMQPTVVSDRNIQFANTADKPDQNFVLRWMSKFYQGPIRYRLSYWYGSNGIVTLGPDFLHLYIMFALRQTDQGATQGQTLVFTAKRRGIHGWLFNRVVLWLTRIAGNYFSVGDTKVFQSIQFDYKTPVPADRAVQAFIRHLERQPLAEWAEPKSAEVG